MDIYTTSLKLAGAEIPSDRVVDGVDLRPALFETGKTNRKTLFYYRGTRLMAVRMGPWKAHYFTRPAYRREAMKKHDPPLLFQLEHDPSEKRNVASDHSDVIAAIQKEVEQHKAKLRVAPSQLEARINP